MKNPLVDENTVVIGNQPESIHLCDECMRRNKLRHNTIQVEPYLRPILNRLSKNNLVYIKTLPHPDKLAKVSGIYEFLKWYGVKEIIGNRKFIYEINTNNPNEKIKIMMIRWDIVPRLESYRKELMNEIKDEG